MKQSWVYALDGKIISRPDLFSNKVNYSHGANKVVIKLPEDKDRVTITVQIFGMGIDNTIGIKYLIILFFILIFSVFINGYGNQKMKPNKMNQNFITLSRTNL